MSRLLPTTTQSGTLAATRSRLQATPVPPDRYSLQQILDDRRDRPCWQGRRSFRCAPSSRSLPGPRGGVSLLTRACRCAVRTCALPVSQHSQTSHHDESSPPQLVGRGYCCHLLLRSVDVLPATSGRLPPPASGRLRAPKTSGARPLVLSRRTTGEDGRRRGQQRKDNRGASSIPQASFLKVPAWLAVVW